MTIEQTVEIPANRQLTIEIPVEIPVGKTILTFTPVPASNDFENPCGIWTTDRDHSEELKTKLQNLKGSLGVNAFGGLDGVEYQHKVREEWGD